MLLLNHQECSLRGILMKEEKPFLIIMLMTSILLLGDLLYRVKVNPQNVDDLLVMMGLIIICYFILLPRPAEAKERLYRIVKGGVIGLFLGFGGVALRDYLTKGSLNWAGYFSTGLGLAMALILTLVAAQLVNWRRK